MNNKIENQPEIPEFVATEIEVKNHIYGDFRRIANITHYSGDVRNWYHAELFYRAILDGYTVAKEKRFYLKNKFTGNYLSIVTESNGFYHVMVRDPNANGLVRSFTQQEIDSMETGSYEQIEVEE